MVSGSGANAVAGKATTGKKKMEIKPIKKEQARQVCFSKRRTGLFKKASELSMLFGAETAIVVFSHSNKAFSFGHPSVEAIVPRAQQYLEEAIARHQLGLHQYSYYGSGYGSINVDEQQQHCSSPPDRGALAMAATMRNAAAQELKETHTRLLKEVKTYRSFSERRKKDAADYLAANAWLASPSFESLDQEMDQAVSYDDLRQVSTAMAKLRDAVDKRQKALVMESSVRELLQASARAVTVCGAQELRTIQPSPLGVRN